MADNLTLYERPYLAYACPPCRPTASGDDQPQASDLVETLREQIAYLKGQLDQEREAGRRIDHLLAAALERIPAIEAPAETTTPEGGSPEPPKRPEKGPEDTGRDNKPPDRGEPERRPWWRRMFN